MNEFITSAIRMLRATGLSKFRENWERATGFIVVESMTDVQNQGQYGSAC